MYKVDTRFLSVLMMGAIILALFSAISSEAESTSNDSQTVNTFEKVRVAWELNDLANPGSNNVFEGWLIDSELGAVSLGRFNLDAKGNPSLTHSEVTVSAKANVEGFFLTIEPILGDDPAPAETQIAAGDFVGDVAIMTIGTVSLTGLVGLTVSMTFDRLEDLGDGWVYEGWLIDNGIPVSSGHFTVTNSSTRSATAQSKTNFTAYVSEKANLSTFFLTIESDQDPNTTPSDTRVIGGNFTNGIADAAPDHPAALGNDFTNASGSYVLVTPSGASTSAPYYNGIWFLNPTTPPTAGLNLPTLPSGWVYEGWIISGTAPISTGIFTSTVSGDSDGAGPNAGPDPILNFVGQDFVNPALDLRGKTAVISIEPYPDNSPAPFIFKPLVDTINDVGGPPATQEMTNNIANMQINGRILIDFNYTYFLPFIAQ